MTTSTTALCGVDNKVLSLGIDFTPEESLAATRVPLVWKWDGPRSSSRGQQGHAQRTVPNTGFDIACHSARTDLTSGTFAVWTWGTRVIPALDVSIRLIVSWDVQHRV